MASIAKVLCQLALMDALSSNPEALCIPLKHQFVGHGLVDMIDAYDMYERVQEQSRKRKRGKWVRCGNLYRKRLCWQTHYDSLTPEAFRVYYRMSEGSFEELLRLVTPHLHVGSCKPNRPITARSCLSMTLRYLAGGSAVCIRNQHGVAKPTFYRCIHRTIYALDNVPALRIRFPQSQQELDEASCGFYAHSGAAKIRGCVGAVDGLLVRIQRPSEKAGMFYSRKGFYAINVQAISDHKRRCTFLSMKVGGRSNDIVAWRETDIYRTGETGNFPRGYFLVGDAAYPNCTYMLSPYTAAQMKDDNGDERDNFNYFQSKMRIGVECLFGAVIRRWGIFWSPLQFRSISMTTMTIRVAFKLHNFCQHERELALGEVKSLETTKRNGTTNDVITEPMLRSKSGWQHGGLLNDVPVGGYFPSRSFSSLRERMCENIALNGLARPPLSHMRRSTTIY